MTTKRKERMERPRKPIKKERLEEAYEIYRNTFNKNLQYIKNVIKDQQLADYVEKSERIGKERFIYGINTLKASLLDKGKRPSSILKLGRQLANLDTELRSAAQAKALRKAYEIARDKEYAETFKKAYEQWEASELIRMEMAKSKGIEYKEKKFKAPKKPSIPSARRLRYEEDDYIYDLVRKRRKELADEGVFNSAEIGRIIATEIFGSP